VTGLDAQTSGGLLLAAPAANAPALLADLRARGLDAALIGEVTPGEPGHIDVQWLFRRPLFRK
jgi:selenide, water dikinase